MDFSRIGAWPAKCPSHRTSAPQVAVVLFKRAVFSCLVILDFINSVACDLLEIPGGPPCSLAGKAFQLKDPLAVKEALDGAFPTDASTTMQARLSG